MAAAADAAVAAAERRLVVVDGQLLATSGQLLATFSFPGLSVGIGFFPADLACAPLSCTLAGRFSRDFRYDNRLSPASAMLADAMRLIDERTRDGSRHFASLPQTASWGDPLRLCAAVAGRQDDQFCGGGARQGVARLPLPRAPFPDRRPRRRFRLFVRDPQCLDLILYQVGYHFERQLGERCSDSDWRNQAAGQS